MLKSFYFWTIDQAKEILIDESNIVAVRAPITICGDIHG